MDVADNIEHNLAKQLTFKQKLCMNCAWQGVKAKSNFTMICMADKKYPTIEEAYRQPDMFIEPPKKIEQVEMGL